MAKHWPVERGGRNTGLTDAQPAKDVLSTKRTAYRSDRSQTCFRLRPLLSHRILGKTKNASASVTGC